MVVGEPSGSTVLINNLDVGNPLHVQNSDNSSSVIIPFKLLGTENYIIWSSVVKLALQSRNKYGFVDGTHLRESYATSDVLSAQWDTCNAMVLTWIMNAVSQDVYIGLVYFENVTYVWKEFKETYDKADGSVVYNLLQTINTCTCEVKCSCDASKELGLHQQLMKLMQFLMGLDDCYQPVKSSLLTRDPLSKVKDAYHVVSREESHRGVPESSGVIESKMNASSFAAKSFNNGNNNSNRRSYNNANNNTIGDVPNNRGSNPNLNCKNYKKIGHTIERCYELFGFPTGFKRSSNLMKKLLSLINETPSASIHANMAGKASFFNGNVWFNINFSKYFFANSSLSVKTITWGWIIDSGATQHLIVSTVGMFNIMDISELKITIGHPNGSLATISHVGNLKLTNNVILYDVLVVSGYCVSLLSVNKLIRDSLMFVGFDENKFYIQDWKREKVLWTGSKTGGLYMFDMNNDCFVGKSNMVVSFHVSKLLWHNRLGHPAHQVLYVLKNDLSNSKNTSVPMCEACHRAKQTKEPFPLSDHKSKSLGEVVHLDLWGPYVTFRIFRYVKCIRFAINCV
ncbi:ribonuclease H-like domain-containing protein [Tanacetum coccineum]